MTITLNEHAALTIRFAGGKGFRLFLCDAIQTVAADHTITLISTQ